MGSPEYELAADITAEATNIPTVTLLNNLKDQLLVSIASSEKYLLASVNKSLAIF